MSPLGASATPARPRCGKPLTVHCWDAAQGNYQRTIPCIGEPGHEGECEPGHPQRSRPMAESPPPRPYRLLSHAAAALLLWNEADDAALCRLVDRWHAEGEAQELAPGSNELHEAAGDALRRCAAELREALKGPYVEEPRPVRSRKGPPLVPTISVWAEPSTPLASDVVGSLREAARIIERAPLLIGPTVRNGDYLYRAEARGAVLEVHRRPTTEPDVCDWFLCAVLALAGDRCDVSEETLASSPGTLEAVRAWEIQRGASDATETVLVSALSLAELRLLVAAMPKEERVLLARDRLYYDREVVEVVTDRATGARHAVRVDPTTVPHTEDA